VDAKLAVGIGTERSSGDPAGDGAADETPGLANPRGGGGGGGGLFAPVFKSDEDDVERR
jgi:hypothetical protein